MRRGWEGRGKTGHAEMRRGYEGRGKTCHSEMRRGWEGIGKKVSLSQFIDNKFSISRSAI